MQHWVCNRTSQIASVYFTSHTKHRPHTGQEPQHLQLQCHQHHTLQTAHRTHVAFVASRRLVEGPQRIEVEGLERCLHVEHLGRHVVGTTESNG